MFSEANAWISLMLTGAARYRACGARPRDRPFRDKVEHPVRYLSISVFMSALHLLLLLPSFTALKSVDTSFLPPPGSERHVSESYS
jgi:hypothetical protein